MDLVCLVPALPADAGPRVRFEPDRWPGSTHALVADDGLHVLLRHALAGEQRLWLPGATPGPGTPLAFHLATDTHAPERMAAAQRFWRLAADPPVTRAPPRAPPPRRDARRLATMLRVLDLREAGMGQRAIARTLLGVEPDTDWSDSPRRSQLRRLLRDAAALVDGGYPQLLRPATRRVIG